VYSPSLIDVVPVALFAHDGVDRLSQPESSLNVERPSGQERQAAEVW
jgi:hypothetical protein